MEYIDAENNPPLGRLVIAHCPDWNDSGYQVCSFKSNRFQYDEDPNGNFNDYVESWCFLHEVE